MFARRPTSRENILTRKGATAFIFQDVGIPVLRANLPSRLSVGSANAARPAAG